MKNTNSKSKLLDTLFQASSSARTEYLASIFCSPSDIGVMRNSGRNGSRYAPEAILNRLKNFNNHFDSEEKILLTELTSYAAELNNYEQARTQAIEKVRKFSHPKTTIHLGGGHDQIYSLLMGLDQSPEIKNLLIINIDAHCDTRISSSPNSGTPFRDYDQLGTKPYHLIQFGLQDFSNSRTTLSPLVRGTEERHYIEHIGDASENFSLIPENLYTNLPFKIEKETAVVFSLDCDGIDGSNMRAVSAVNPNGLPASFVSKLSHHFHQSFPVSKKFYGIYEFNPVYDDSSQYSTKVVAALIFDILKFK